MSRANGFSLVEVVISAALIASTVGALFAAASMAVRLSSSGQQRLIAAQLAREGIETVRLIRDTNFVANPCAVGVACLRKWTDGILEPTEILPLSRPVFKHSVVTDSGTKLQTVLPSGASDTSLTCSDTIVRHTRPGDATGFEFVTPPFQPTENQEVYCRRILIESVTDSTLRTDTIRVRSQVAWLADSKKTLRSLSSVAQSPECVGAGDSAKILATEWCTEQVTLLTNWRTSL